MRTITPLTIIPVLVDNQDEALQFYTEKLGLEKRTDVSFGPGLRWLTVAPNGQKKPEIALAVADASLQHLQRDQEVTRCSRPWQGVSGIFDTIDCARMYAVLLARGVKFVSLPTRRPYGTEAVFEDPYGNRFSLLEPSPEAYAMFAGASIGTAA